MLRISARNLAALLLTLSSACAQQLKPPTALATGPSQVAVGTTVQVNGASSHDPQSLPLTFQWKLLNLPAGSQATLNDPSAINPSFLVDVDGTYVVQLVVTDGKLASVPATASIQAGPCGLEALGITVSATVLSGLVHTGPAPVDAGPILDAGPDLPDAGNEHPDAGRPPVDAGPAHVDAGAGEEAGVGGLVQLRASVQDPNLACSPNADAGTGAEVFTYSWSFVSLPPASGAAFNHPAVSEPSFVVDVPGSYVAAVVATSPSGVSGRGTVTVTVSSCGGNAPEIETIAANPASPSAGELITLNPTVLQPDNQAPCDASETLSYAWSMVGLPPGSHAQLNSTTVFQPSFVADVGGTYAVSLVVTDSAQQVSAALTLTLAVSACGSSVPRVTAVTSAPADPDTGQTVQLTATLADSDATSCGLSPGYTYAWQLAGQPSGSHASLNNSAASDPSFLADLPGTYQVALVVTKVEVSRADGGAADGGTSDSTSQSLAPPISSAAFTGNIVVSTCGSAAPTLVPNVIPAPDVGQAVQLGVAVSDSNAGGSCNLPESFSYLWTTLSLPLGSTATLNSAVASGPTFTPDVPGEYQFGVVVTDSSGQSSTEAVVVVSAAVCGSAVPSVVATATTTSPSVGQAVQLLATPTDSDSQSPCDQAVALSVAWQLLQLPVGSRAALNAPHSENPSFVPDVTGPYVFVVAVTDQHGRSSVSAPLTVTASSCGSLAPQVTVSTPGSGTSSFNTSAVVQLASTVTDPNTTGTCTLAETESYAWSLVSLPSGSRAQLNNRAATNPSFSIDVPGAYVVQLTVTDSSGNSASQQLTVTGLTCGSNSPTISGSSFATIPAAPVIGQAAQLSATVSDADNASGCALGRTLSYHWTLVGAPTGSQAALANPQSLSPSFVPDVAGQFSFSLTVTDNLGRSTTSPSGTWTVTVTNCGAAKPTISLTTVSVDTAQPAQLGGIVTDANTACAADFPNESVTADTYAWRLESLPAGSNARLNSAVAQNPSFDPDVPGTYVASVVVTDGLGNSSLPTTQTINVSVCGSAAAVPVISVASFTVCVCSPACVLTTEVCETGTGTAASPCTVTLAKTTQAGCSLNGKPLVSLTGAGSTDADNLAPCSLDESISYAWTMMMTPVDSTAALEPNLTSETPWFAIDQAGVFEVSLSASDGTSTPVNPPGTFFIKAH